MSDLVPRIDRSALERIIQRAAELQAGEREIGDGLTEGELMQLGADVGIPGAYLRQALMEERARSVMQGGRGMGVWLTGPRQVGAARTMPGNADALRAALHQWMTESELLQVKRRYPEQTSWEPKQGTIVTLQRSLGIGGRDYALAKTREVVGRVAQVDETRCHVQLLADLTESYRQHLWGAGLLAGASVVAAGALVGVGIAAPLALLPAVGGIPLAGLAARSRRRTLERTQVALEQVLDRLEHGEIRVREPGAPRAGPFARLTEEIRRSFGI